MIFKELQHKKPADLKNGEEAVAHFLNENIPLLSVMLDWDGRGEHKFRIRVDDVKLFNEFDEEELPETLREKLTHLYGFLMKNELYQELQLFFQFINGDISLFAVMSKTNRLLSFQTTKQLAKELSIKCLSPNWRGEYQPNVEATFLKSAVIQRA